jgi:hypothetical protein
VTGRHDTPNGRTPQLERHLTFRCFGDEGVGGRGQGGFGGWELSQYANGFHFNKIFSRTELFPWHAVPYAFVVTNSQTVF